MAKAPYINDFVFLRNGGSEDANVDGSSTPVEFSYTVPAGDTFWANRMVVLYEDTGGFSASIYGAESVLANGIGLKLVFADGSEQDLMDGVPLKSNAEWAGRCYDWAYIATGQGNNFAAARWTFGETGRPIQLNEGEKIVVTINDNMLFLVSQTFQIQGVRT